jgi:apolipoprotein N-acyltransferase
MGIIEQKVKFGATGYVELSENKLIKSTPFKLYKNKIFLILILIYIFLIFSFNRIKHE